MALPRRARRYASARIGRTAAQNLLATAQALQARPVPPPAES